MVNIPGTYKVIYKLEVAPNETNNDDGKLLKSVFTQGPSKAVLQSGKVTVSVSPVAQDQDPDDQNNSEQNTNNSGNNTNNNKSPNESYHYSIYEAYSRHRLFEADKKPGELNNKSDNTSDQSTKSDAKSSERNSATDLEVVVNLPGEGCTKWHLRLHKNIVDKQRVINAIQSKKFKAAIDIANTQLKESGENEDLEGFKVLSATTMLDKAKEKLAPFIGKCRYAFDVGSKDDADQAYDLEIAIAPIDGQTKKPKESTIYRTIYTITGDITNSQLEIFTTFTKFKDAIQGNNSDYRDSAESDYAKDPSEDLSKWIHSKFKSPGDSSMYKQFLNIRKFLEEQIKNKTVEFASDNEGCTKSVQYYADSILKGEKSLITF
jgi:hypothetical protein